MQPKSDSSVDALVGSYAAEGLPDARRSLELLAIAQGGDRDALEQLIKRYQSRIQRIVRIQLGSSVVRREYDSMDIVQNTFRAALPKIGNLRPRSTASLLQWLAIIATNQIRDAHSKMHAAKRDVDLEVRVEHSSGDGNGSLACPREDAGPAQRASLAEIRELLDAAVSGLPEDQRRAVLLRDYCGESWKRIGVELNREVGAARQLHQRAWISLRRELRPKLEDGTF